MRVETLNPIRNEAAVADRARDLALSNLNGLAAALVTLGPPLLPEEARIELHFANDRHVSDILDEIIADPGRAVDIFPIRGGHRVLGGLGDGQIRCVSVTAGPTPESLALILSPIGDYSTYTLEIMFDPARIDPYFACLDLKFRPGCFTGACAPDWADGRARRVAPAIDYMAKDYDSFRHQLIAAMMDRVPGWQPSSEADMDQMLIGLFSAAGDELSDYQDRVMAEGYLGSARKRVSVANHARLMDYYINEGNQATSWVWLEIAEAAAAFTLDDDLIAWAGDAQAESGTIPFATRQAGLNAGDRTEYSPEFNRFHMHSWAGADAALPRGATQADIVPAPTPTAPAGLVSANALAEAINAGRLSRILIEEILNPLTGRVTGRDPAKRQLLALMPEAQVITDPLAGLDVVRVQWVDADALTHDYSFVTNCPEGPVENISIFRGNLAEMHQGMPVRAVFHEKGTDLPVDGPTTFHRHFSRHALYGETKGIYCELPKTPLAYLAGPRGGEVPARSTLRVAVDEPGGATNLWDERPTLVFSDDSSEEGDHFVVETDERQRSRLKFGNGINGRLIPQGARVLAQYQLGGGVAGNVGMDAIHSFVPLPAPNADAIEAVSNPFDVTNGAAPEPVAEVLRNAPEAYRARQLRAVTLADYIRRAEEVAGIARAVASYAWTGSWRTVRIVLDPAGATDLSADLVRDVSLHLEAVRLIGEDLELRAPRFVPLTLDISVCLAPDAWPEDLRHVIEQELSAGYTPDGRPGLFHPDSWTFGQALDRSQIAGRLHMISGIEHILGIRMRRRDAPTPGRANPKRLETAFDEIVLVENDPDHMERGIINLDVQGGRQ